MSPSQSSRQFQSPDTLPCDSHVSDHLKEYRNVQNKSATTCIGCKSPLSGNKDRTCSTYMHESDFESSSQDETIATDRLKKTILSLLGAATKASKPPPEPVNSTMLDFTSWMDLALDLLHSEELRDAVANWVREQLPRAGVSRILSKEAAKSDKDDASSTWDGTKSITSGVSDSVGRRSEHCDVTRDKIDSIQSALQSILRSTVAERAPVPPPRSIRTPISSPKISNGRELCATSPTKSQTTQTSPLLCGPVWRFHQCFDATRETQTYETVEPPTKMFVFKPFNSDRHMCEATSVMTQASQTAESEPHQWSPRVNSRRSRIASETLTMTTKRFTFRPCKTTPTMCVATALLSRATQTARPVFMGGSRCNLASRGVPVRADPRHYTLSIPRNTLYHPQEVMEEENELEIEYCSCPRPEYGLPERVFHGERDLDYGDTAEREDYQLQSRRFPALPPPSSPRPPPPPPPPVSRRNFRLPICDTDTPTLDAPCGSRPSYRWYPGICPAPGVRRARSRQLVRSRGAVSEALPRPITRAAPADLPRSPPARGGGNGYFRRHLDCDWNDSNGFCNNYRNTDTELVMLPSRRHPHTADETQYRNWYNSGAPETLSDAKDDLTQPWKNFQTYNSSERYKRSGWSNRRNLPEDDRFNVAVKCNFHPHLGDNKFCPTPPKRTGHWTEMQIHKTEETQTFQNKKPYNRDVEKLSREQLDIRANALDDSSNKRRSNDQETRHSKVSYLREEKSLTSLKYKEIAPDVLSEFSQEMLISSDTEEIVEEQNALSAVETPSSSTSSGEDSRIYFAHDQNLGYKTTAKDSELLASNSEKEISEKVKPKPKGQVKSSSTRRRAKLSHHTTCNASKTKSNQDTAVTKCKRLSSCDRNQPRKHIGRNRRRGGGCS